MEVAQMDKPDTHAALESMLVTRQSKERIREVIEGMSERDRDLLRACFLEERDKDEVCRQFG